MRSVAAGSPDPPSATSAPAPQASATPSPDQLTAPASENDPNAPSHSLSDGAIASPTLVGNRAVANRVVAIDPGHGGRETGAVHRRADGTVDLLEKASISRSLFAWSAYWLPEATNLLQHAFLRHLREVDYAHPIDAGFHDDL